MKSERHESFQEKIDEMLAAGGAIEEDNPLREHLQSCVLCQQYLAASNRVLVGLDGFSFEMDPALGERINAALRTRAQQFETTTLDRNRLVVGCLIALGLTAGGSFVDLQLGSFLAPLLAMTSRQAQHSLVELWIVPSVVLLLLFPILPLLSAAGMNRTERGL